MKVACFFGFMVNFIFFQSKRMSPGLLTGNTVWINFCTFLSFVNIPDPNFIPIPIAAESPIPRMIPSCDINE